MSKTILGVFSSEQQAEKAVHALRSKGFDTNEISIVQKHDHKGHGHGADEGLHRNSSSKMGVGGAGNRGDFSFAGDESDSVADGVASGAAWGGIAGLALGAGALAVPGIGPLLAAGPLAAALTGAATGGLAGGLIDWGVPESVGREYETRVREGGVLAVIRVSARKADEAAKILREYGASDVGSHDSTK